MKTLFILLLASGIVQHIVVDGDHRRFNNLSFTTQAQPTAEHERAQDELFHTLFVLDDRTNQNVPIHPPFGEYQFTQHDHQIVVRE